MWLSADRVVTGHEVFAPGRVRLDHGRITGVGPGLPPEPATAHAAVIVPGFVDVHVHGGGGGGFPTGDPREVDRAIAAHRWHGTTTMLASLVTAAPDDLLRCVALLADRVEAGDLGGIHLEGPWLAPEQRGAHPQDLLRDPDPREWRELWAASRGTIRMVTLAPERPGALDLIREITAQGVVAAVGHTVASYECTQQALNAGARVGTHLFNAMQSIHHREPGPVVALMEDDRVTVELITDGVHLHHALYRNVSRAIDPDRIALVTDAMAAAGTADGHYVLGELPVEVRGGVARVAGTDTIAGSTATMDLLFRRAVSQAGPDPDQALLTAARQTSLIPARTLGLPPAELAAGLPGDLVLLDDRLIPLSVWRHGVRVR